MDKVPIALGSTAGQLRRQLLRPVVWNALEHVSCWSNQIIDPFFIGKPAEIICAVFFSLNGFFSSLYRSQSFVFKQGYNLDVSICLLPTLNALQGSFQYSISTGVLIVYC